MKVINIKYNSIEELAQGFNNGIVKDKQISVSDTTIKELITLLKSDGINSKRLVAEKLEKLMESTQNTK